MVFIDGSNMYHSLKAFFKRTDLDLALFSRKLIEKRHLVRMYYYNAVVGKQEEPERFKDQEKFFKSVSTIPYTELRLGRLVYTNQWPGSPPFEKGVDVQLATDMITHAFKNNFDVAILVAGDNDFVGAIQAVKDNGKHVEVALFGQERTSRQLRDAADRIITLDGRIMRGCWKGPQSSQGNSKPRLKPVSTNNNTKFHSNRSGQHSEPYYAEHLKPANEIHDDVNENGQEILPLNSWHNPYNGP
ncbi:MAG: NYN domain-containing protein [Dehalococcoidia bacterium]|nr:NYN domain-containing protein [Dehalococcoidia bacterium]